VQICINGVRALILRHVGAQLVDQANAASLVAGRVDEYSPAFGGDTFQCFPELDPAVAPQGTENIPG
jgi:hypothetical protein